MTLTTAAVLCAGAGLGWSVLALVCGLSKVDASPLYLVALSVVAFAAAAVFMLGGMP